MEPAALKSFFPYAHTHHFPLENIPFGAFHCSKLGKLQCCTRIGDFIVNLAAAFDVLKVGTSFADSENFFDHDNLNKFAAMGPAVRKEVRARIQTEFAADSSNKDALKDASTPADSVTMSMPMFVRDYTDFYSSKNHAFNIGVMFRGKDNALQPNWTHLPVGYHGRASSVVVSGTPIVRPRGQVSADMKTPAFADCGRLDFELEMGTYIGTGNALGEPIKIGQAADHIFGYCLLNDWSARDLQKWEYVPLGPFLAKNFGSTVSPWVITPEALAPFKKALPAQDPELLPYLQDPNLSAYDINLQVHLKPVEQDKWHILTKSNMCHLYYSVPQTIAHHSCTGCNMSTGDLLGTGTISSTEKEGYGSMVELCWGGKEPIELGDGVTRCFLKDGDEVNMIGTCEGNGFTIGFGDCLGKVLPARTD